MKRKWKINPIYGKELKVNVRTFKFALYVTIYNLILVGIALFSFEILFNVAWNNVVKYSSATAIYAILVAVEIAMIIFIVPANTAGCIAGEREKQTLEILLTTVMTPWQIILGKLQSSISMIMLLVLSSLPVISIVFTIGGIGLMDLLQFVIVVLVTAIYVGSMGVLASCLFRRTVQSTVLSYGFIVVACLVTVLIPIVAYTLSNMYYYNVMMAQGTAPNVGWSALPMLLNPVVTVVSMIFTQYAGIDIIQEALEEMGGMSFVGEHWFYISLAVQLGVSALLLWIAQKMLNPLRKIRYKNKKKRKKKSK